jgi:RimJ/RimL family protein N-acetyltransferase
VSSVASIRKISRLQRILAFTPPAALKHEFSDVDWSPASGLTRDTAERLWSSPARTARARGRVLNPRSWDRFVSKVPRERPESSCCRGPGSDKLLRQGAGLPDRWHEVHRITLRAASFDDAATLYRWRTDQATRAASHDTTEITFDAHTAWLTKPLADPTRTSYIAEHNGLPVGTVRADLRDGVCRLSWTVAPEYRGQGLGTEMVGLLAASIRGPITADVKLGNLASIRIAESAGMRLAREQDGILHFVRGPVTGQGRLP